MNQTPTPNIFCISPDSLIFKPITQTGEVLNSHLYLFASRMQNLPALLDLSGKI
jgi:hypothetical protein